MFGNIYIGNNVRSGENGVVFADVPNNTTIKNQILLFVLIIRRGNNASVYYYGDFQLC